MENDKTDSIRLVSDPTERMVKFRSAQPQNESESAPNRKTPVEPRSNPGLAPTGTHLWSRWLVKYPHMQRLSALHWIWELNPAECSLD